MKILLNGVEYYKREAGSKRRGLIGRRMEEGTIWIARKMTLDVLSSAQSQMQMERGIVCSFMREMA